MRSMRSRKDERAAWSTVTSVLALARALEGGGHGLEHRRQLGRREGDEGHARAIGVVRTAWTIAITVERRSVGALETVVFADSPFFHADRSSQAWRVWHW